MISQYKLPESAYDNAIKDSAIKDEAINDDIISGDTVNDGIIRGELTNMVINPVLPILYAKTGYI